MSVTIATMNQFYYFPPSKITGGDDSFFSLHSPCNNAQHNLRIAEGRRASIAHFMEHGTSPSNLDTSIGKDIFDCSHLGSSPVKTRSKVLTEWCPPPPFSNVTTIRKSNAVGDEVTAPYPLSAQATRKCTKYSNKQLLPNDTQDNHEQSEFQSTMAKTSDAVAKIRSHQAEGWMEKYNELFLYKMENGTCLVPNQYPSNPSLAEVSVEGVIAVFRFLVELLTLSVT